MLKRIGSHAARNLVAYIALFVALGGSAYAATEITGRQVADGSLSGSDIRDRSLPATKLTLSAQAARGRRGPRGLRGPRGFQGYQGPAGPQGAPGVSGYEVVNAKTSGVDSATSKAATALCPAGKRVFGGGADVDGVNPDGASGPARIPVYLNNSSPTSANGQAGWTATAYEDTGGYDEGWALSVWAICGNAQ